MSKQTDVYSQLVRPIVMEMIEGYNCTIFTYGQTGSGKTYTMEGDFAPSNDNMSWQNDSHAGIIPRSVSHLFSVLNAIANSEYSVKISYMLLYKEELSDLLNDSAGSNVNLDFSFDSKGSVVIPGLREIVVKNTKEVLEILRKGNDRKCYEPDDQGIQAFRKARLSSSHSIFVVTVFLKEKSSIDGEETIKVSKLNLVDLAGSEKIEEEETLISQSLTTFDRVIKGLANNSLDFNQYRESKLTWFLKDSLGGKTLTTLITTISLDDIKQTKRTINFSQIAKRIIVNPELNQKMSKTALININQDEINKLNGELDGWLKEIGTAIPPYLYDTNMKEKYMEYLNAIRILKTKKQKIEQLFAKTSQNLSERVLSFDQNFTLKEEMLLEHFEVIKKIKNSKNFTF